MISLLPFLDPFLGYQGRYIKINMLTSIGLTQCALSRKSTRDLHYCVTTNRGPTRYWEGAPFEERTSFKDSYVCSDAIYRINA